VNGKFKIGKKSWMAIVSITICLIVILAIVLRPHPTVWGTPRVAASCEHMDNGVKLTWVSVHVVSMLNGFDEEENKRVLLALDNTHLLLFKSYSSLFFNETLEELQEAHQGVRFNDTDSSGTLSEGDTVFIPYTLWNKTVAVRIGIYYPDGFFSSLPT